MQRTFSFLVLEVLGIHIIFMRQYKDLYIEEFDVFFTMDVYQVPLGSTFTAIKTHCMHCMTQTKLMTHFNNERAMWCATEI